MELDQLPHLISFPRSGSHWIHCTLEVACGRRRVFRTEAGPASLEPPITFVSANTPTAPAWVHAHNVRDRKAVVKVVYLYRDPVDTLYSLFSTRQPGRRNEDEFLEVAIPRWIAHTTRFMLSDDKADQFVKYENVVANQLGVMSDIAVMLGQPRPTVAKMTSAMATITMQKITQHNRPKFSAFFNPTLLTPEYIAGRTVFRARNADRIYGAMIPELKAITGTV